MVSHGSGLSRQGLLYWYIQRNLTIKDAPGYEQSGLNLEVVLILKQNIISIEFVSENTFFVLRGSYFFRCGSIVHVSARNLPVQPRFILLPVCQCINPELLIQIQKNLTL